MFVFFFKRATSKNISLVKFSEEVGTCVYKIGSTIFKRGSPSNANEQKIQAKKHKAFTTKMLYKYIRLDENVHWLLVHGETPEVQVFEWLSNV